MASQWIVSSTSTGVCFTSKLDAQVSERLAVFVRHLVLVHVVHEPCVVPNFQIRQLTHHFHVTLHLRGFPEYRRNQESALPVDLHHLTVIVRAGQEFLLGPVVRGDFRQLFFDLSPNLHRVYPRVVPFFTGYVEAIAVLFELLQKGRGNLETALLVHFCRYVSPKHVVVCKKSMKNAGHLPLDCSTRLLVRHGAYQLRHCISLGTTSSHFVPRF